MKKTNIAAFILLCQVCFGQEVEQASSISPEDLGAYKWTLSGTAQENHVVIFRMTTVTEWNKHVTTKIYDSVCYQPGKKATSSAVFIDPGNFDSTRIAEPKWHFGALGGACGWIEGEFAGYSCSSDKAEINFTSEKFGKTKKIFEVFVKPYQEAAMLYDQLPEISPKVNWRWSGYPKGQSEQ